MKTLDFWYEFASTYSYPAAMRIEAAAAKAGVALRWRPFLLGPIFAAQGMKDSPFNIFPVKGRYMWRDMERICSGLGLSWRQPSPFPQNGVLAARCVLALDEGGRPAFSKGIYTAQFGEGRNIAEQSTIAGVLTALGHDAAAVIAKAISQPIKEELRTETEEAQRLGIFGAPTMVTPDGELFWGNDRLDDAIAWATRGGA
jgi:2-hydroxychromene-2-carboxylate isomerase